SNPGCSDGVLWREAIPNFIPPALSTFILSPILGMFVYFLTSPKLGRHNRLHNTVEYISFPFFYNKQIWVLIYLIQTTT
ncbi:hypothetical protein L9F63_000124, partial [Diploptera punctata]